MRPMRGHVWRPLPEQTKLSTRGRATSHMYRLQYEDLDHFEVLSNSTHYCCTDGTMDGTPEVQCSYSCSCVVELYSMNLCEPAR